MSVTSEATTSWKGSLTEGSGEVALESSNQGPLAVNWKARSEGSTSVTTPEELIAAAHSSCFSMALSHALAGNAKALREGGPVKALFIQNTNPANVAPDQTLVREGFLREDLFVVVHEQFMTDTAKLADIVLPATMFLEHNDYYTRSGHTRVLFGPKLVEAPGEAKPNFWVINELLARLGTTEDPAMQMTDREVVAATLKSSGYGDLDEIEAHGGLVETHWAGAGEDLFDHSDPYVCRLRVSWPRPHQEEIR